MSIFSRVTKKIKKNCMIFSERNYIPRGIEEEQAGKIFEGLLFGGVPKTSVGEYEEQEATIERIKRIQEHSENPHCPFMRKFLEVIVVEMKRFKGESDEVAKKYFPDPRMRMYTAVGSSLDTHQGIDAFVEWICPNGEVRRVTLDATLKSIKDTYKVDILFSFPEELKRNFTEETFRENLDKGIYDRVVYEVASEVVRRLKRLPGEKKGTFYCEAKREGEKH